MKRAAVEADVVVNVIVNPRAVTVRPGAVEAGMETRIGLVVRRSPKPMRNNLLRNRKSRSPNPLMGLAI